MSGRLSPRTLLFVISILTVLLLGSVYPMSSTYGLLGASYSRSSSSSLRTHNIPNVLASGGVCEPLGNAEVEQAVDPTNGYIYEAWIGCSGIGFARSIDGGKNFETAYTVPGSFSSFDPNTESETSPWDPAVVVSETGTVYVSYMLGTTSFLSTTGLPVGAPQVAISYDHGDSFSQVSRVFNPPSPSFSDRDFIAVGEAGTIYVTWDYSPDSSLITLACAAGGSCFYYSGDFNAVISTSKDGGKTWSTPAAINPDYPKGGAITAPIIAEPDGALDVLYLEYSVSSTHVLAGGNEYFVQSTDGGNSWSSRVKLVGGDGSFQTPTEWWIDGSIARDKGGVLYASFDTQSSGQNNAWLTYSLNDGRTWAPAKLLGGAVTLGTLHIEAEVNGAESHSSYVAWLSIDPGGGWRVYVQSIRVGSPDKVLISPPLLISNQTGLPGIWGGDTIGINSLGENKVVVSWGYGVNVNGGILPQLSEIFETVIPRSYLLGSVASS